MKIASALGCAINIAGAGGNFVRQKQTEMENENSLLDYLITEIAFVVPISSA